MDLLLKELNIEIDGKDSISYLTKRSIWLAIKYDSELYSCRFKQVNYPGRPPEPYTNYNCWRYEILAHNLIVLSYPSPRDCCRILPYEREFAGDIKGVLSIEIDGKMWKIEDSIPLSKLIY